MLVTKFSIEIDIITTLNRESNIPTIYIRKNWWAVS